MSCSAALCGGAYLFVPEIDVEGVELEAGVLKTFGRLSGFVFKGFVLGLRPTEGIDLAENDKTTFSVPSSRFRPSPTGGGDPKEPEPEAPCPSSPPQLTGFDSSIHLIALAFALAILRCLFRPATVSTRPTTPSSKFSSLLMMRRGSTIYDFTSGFYLLFISYFECSCVSYIYLTTKPPEGLSHFSALFLFSSGQPE
ncbi:hypothetical protein BDM02DRAFT_3115865 [Thelephora ganbajun]|uniref:Uncharacterized protein n=1 Tax=Thelephora ganbajun TaxID=370292 RepID=A0ACB6ZE51_THEGA|nr:hypothetical protein BDM02DRAFT_3115865 [Thelephora ganbajun]